MVEANRPGPSRSLPELISTAGLGSSGARGFSRAFSTSGLHAPSAGTVVDPPEPPATDWFTRSLDLSWTHDPFDRLIIAHALVRRWRLATADQPIVQRLGSTACIEL